MAAPRAARSRRPCRGTPQRINGTRPPTRVDHYPRIVDRLLLQREDIRHHLRRQRARPVGRLASQRLRVPYRAAATDWRCSRRPQPRPAPATPSRLDPAPNGSGTAPTGPRLRPNLTMPAANVTLCAQSTSTPPTPSPSTPTAEPDDGPRDPQRPNGLDGQRLHLSGYTFNDWNTVAGGTGTSYANGATYPSPPTSRSMPSGRPLSPSTPTAEPGRSPTRPRKPDGADPQHLHADRLRLLGCETSPLTAQARVCDGATYPFTVSVTLYAQSRATVSCNGN